MSERGKQITMYAKELIYAADGLFGEAERLWAQGSENAQEVADLQARSNYLRATAVSLCGDVEATGGGAGDGS